MMLKKTYWLFSIVLLLCGGEVLGQTAQESGSSLAGAVPGGEERKATISVDSLPELQAMPGDVLNPDVRGNSTDIKIGLKAGINRGAYSNDRFLDNRPFDVGAVGGEQDLYGSGAGFGWQVGLEVEIPRNSVFAWGLSARYDHVAVGNRGIVEDPCRTAAGDTIDDESFHRYDLTIDYLKAAGVAKLNFRSFYLLLGLTVGTPLSNEIRFEQTSGTTSCVYLDPDDLRSHDGPMSIPEIARLHFAFRLGGGLTYQLTDKLQFSPELTLDFGINAINKAPESDLGVYGINAVLRYDL